MSLNSSSKRKREKKNSFGFKFHFWLNLFHVGRVTPGALEVEASQLHLLVDVHVREQLDLGVLGQMESGLAGPPLVVGQRENRILHTASGVHSGTFPFFYEQKVVV